MNPFLSHGADRRLASRLFIALLAALLAGCATPETRTGGNTRVMAPDQEDNLGGTFLESGDIRTIASRMAGAILSAPEVARHPDGASIAVAPIRNSTRHLIDKDLLMARLRIELNKNAQGRVRFLSQDLGQEVRTEILRSQDEEQWDGLLDQCAQAIVGSTIVTAAKAPVRVAVIPVRNVNLAGVNADSFTALLRSKVSEQAQGKVAFLGREENGRAIQHILAESDLRNLGLVDTAHDARIAGADYFLGGEFVAESLTPQAVETRSQTAVGTNPDDPRKLEVTRNTGAALPNANKHLRVMLINAATGTIPVEKMVRLERKMKSGLAGASYILTGELRALSKAAAGGDRSDYVVMSFQLVEPRSNTIIWEDAYETKKSSKVGVIYK